MISDDGYIKFNCTLREATPPNAESLSALNGWRTQLHSIGLVGMYPDGIGYGNVSQRIEGNQFLISGTATGAYKTLNNTHYVTVDSFNIDDNSLTCSGLVNASSESLSHAAIYRSSPLVQYVLHIHHEALWTKHYNRYPTTSSDISYGTPEMAYALEKIMHGLSDFPQLIIMGGHREGVIACGSDLSQTANLLLELVHKL